jgi:hypothetical protein
LAKRVDIPNNNIFEHFVMSGETSEQCSSIERDDPIVEAPQGEREKTWFGSVVHEVHDDDVLLGRGKSNMKHVGNLKFQGKGIKKYWC